MANNNQIDRTSYYVLPCGLNLEDFIHYKKLNFNTGSAVKYLYRAGNKDGESHEKDLNKCYHYVRQEAMRNHLGMTVVWQMVQDLVAEAKVWNPSDECVKLYTEPVPDWRPTNG